MKKTTMIFGIISCFLFLLGSAFKIMHWPGAGPALTLSVALFALGYTPLLMLDKNKLTQSGLQKLVNVSAMIAMLLVSISFLFKAQHWPGAGIGIIAGNIVLLIMIPILFIHAARESDTVKKLNFYNEAILLVFITSFSYFLWLVIMKG